MLTTSVTSAGALATLLARKPARRVNWGLGRMRFMLRALGNPEADLEVIHVAGTNGKGSVVVTADSILRAGGLRTGRYTSPHLVGFSERIVIDGCPAENELLESCARDVLPLANKVDATFFEATTALAFEVFGRSGVTTAVVEVGLGGRLDATNVLDASVAVVTSIANDHADYLGTDLVAIAREKAGIISNARTAVIGPVGGDAGDLLVELAADSSERVLRFGREMSAQAVEIGSDGTSFTYRCGDARGPLRLHTPLHGRHQATNAALAVAATDAFTGGVLDDAQLQAGVGAVNWPGRFQVEHHGDGTWVYDIAHNSAAAQVLADIVQQFELPGPIVLLASVLGDKDWTAVLAPLLEVVETAVFTVAPSAPSERRWDVSAACEALDGSAAIEVVPDFDRALVTARARAGAGTVLVTGSCHTVGDALRRNGSA